MNDTCFVEERPEDYYDSFSAIITLNKEWHDDFWNTNSPMYMNFTMDLLQEVCY